MTTRNVARFMLAGILLVLVVLAPFPGQSRLLRSLHNAAHAPIFGCIALLGLTALRSHRRFSAWNAIAQYAAALSIAALFGAATELMQIPAGRDASLFDMRNDLVGAVAFLAVFAVFDAKASVSGVKRPALLILAAGAMMVVALPAFKAAVEHARREAQFPVLADFVRRSDRYYMAPQSAAFERVPLPSPWSTSGEQAMRVTFQSGAWPGLNFFEPSPDWSGYSNLMLDLANPADSALQLVIRIHDRWHNQQFDDRFNGRYDIAAKTRVVLRIPLAPVQSAPRTRLMDMREISGVILFRVEGSTADEMYVSRIWLE